MTAWLAGSEVRPSCRREGRLVGVETGAALRFRGLGGETGPIQPITSPPTATVIKVSSFNKEQVRLESCFMLV